MQVRTLLQKKGRFVATVPPEMKVRQAIIELARYDIGALVVTRPDRSIAGIISERDIVRALGRDGASILDEPASHLMSTAVTTCALDDEVDSLMTIMTNERVRHIPVTTTSALVGIVSIGDVVKTRMDELVHDRDTLVSYINAR